MAQSESLTNLQQELLKVFSLNLCESELLEIKSLIAGYFAEKAINLADLKKKGGQRQMLNEWHLQS